MCQELHFDEPYQTRIRDPAELKRRELSRYHGLPSASVENGNVMTKAVVHYDSSMFKSILTPFTFLNITAGESLMSPLLWPTP